MANMPFKGSGAKAGMIDNRKVKDTHQEGISRVKQRKGDMEKGEMGKMTSRGSANWSKRSSGTPKSA
jgi:hypothetical protein